MDCRTTLSHYNIRQISLMAQRGIHSTIIALHFGLSLAELNSAISHENFQRESAESSYSPGKSRPQSFLHCGRTGRITRQDREQLLEVLF